MKGLYAIYRKEMGHYFVSPVAYIIVGVFLILSGYFFNRLLVVLISNPCRRRCRPGKTAARRHLTCLAAHAHFLGIVIHLAALHHAHAHHGCLRRRAQARHHGAVDDLAGQRYAHRSGQVSRFADAAGDHAVPRHAASCLHVRCTANRRAPWRCSFRRTWVCSCSAAACWRWDRFSPRSPKARFIAAILTFGGLLLLWVLDYGQPGSGSPVASTMQYLSIFRHVRRFHARRDRYFQSLIFYAQLYFASALFLTVRSLDSMRWRRARCPARVSGGRS